VQKTITYIAVVRFADCICPKIFYTFLYSPRAAGGKVPQVERTKSLFGERDHTFLVQQIVEPVSFSKTNEGKKTTNFFIFK